MVLIPKHSVPEPEQVFLKEILGYPRQRHIPFKIGDKYLDAVYNMHYSSRCA